MASKMFAILISLIFSVIGCNAAGELTILHSPESLKFSGSEKALESTLKEIFSACFGLSVEESSGWNGLSILDPFHTPEAVVEVYVDGVATLGTFPEVKQFSLIVDEYEPETFNVLRHRINQRYSSDRSKLVNINLADPDVSALSNAFGEMTIPKVTKQTLQHLKHSVEEDSQFLQELATLNAVIAKVQSSVLADNAIDFYYFRFSSLHALSDFHGPNSLQAKEAKKLLRQSLQDLSEAFVRAYSGSVVVSAVTTDVAHTRRAARLPRQAEVEDPAIWKKDEEGAPEDPPEADSPAAPPEDPPAEPPTPESPPPPPPASPVKEDNLDGSSAAIFNIILWFSIALAFSLIAIVYTIMDMDPGRDSIIYRMTSTRMKKDN